MSDRDRAFDDVVEDQGFGALGGRGIEELEKVQTKLTPTGIENTCRCGHCNTGNVITVEWKEAIVGAMSLVPPGWQGNFKSQTIYPSVGCAACNNLIPLHFSSGELRNYVDRGIAQNLIDKNWANQVAAGAQQSVQATAGLMQRR